MNVVETASIKTADLPISAFRDHLRLGTGFGQDSLQDNLLEACLRAALGRVEGHCGKSILSRTFTQSISDWRELSRQVLPLAPVGEITRISVFDRAGTETVVGAEQYRLIQDGHHPTLASSGYSLPNIPYGGRVEIAFTAGYPSWSAVPPDLAQAVMLLAAAFYENRDGMSSQGMPALVKGLLARYRVMRLGAGDAS